VKIHAELPDKDCPQEGKVRRLHAKSVVRIFDLFELMNTKKIAGADKTFNT
jgi:hypothetical protein